MSPTTLNIPYADQQAAWDMLETVHDVLSLAFHDMSGETSVFTTPKHHAPLDLTELRKADQELAQQFLVLDDAMAECRTATGLLMGDDADPSSEYSAGTGTRREKLEADVKALLEYSKSTKHRDMAKYLNARGRPGEGSFELLGVMARFMEQLLTRTSVNAAADAGTVSTSSGAHQVHLGWHMPRLARHVLQLTVDAMWNDLSVIPLPSSEADDEARATPSLGEKLIRLKGTGFKSEVVIEAINELAPWADENAPY